MLSRVVTVDPGHVRISRYLPDNAVAVRSSGASPWRSRIPATGKEIEVDLILWRHAEAQDAPEIGDDLKRRLT
jgi:hypothetical protein